MLEIKHAVCGLVSRSHTLILRKRNTTKITPTVPPHTQCTVLPRRFSYNTEMSKKHKNV